jgi:formate transporter
MPPAGPESWFDALPPAATARKVEKLGVAKATMPSLDLVVLAVLAGAFIALGGAFSTTVLAESGELPFGVARLLAGVAFSLGLILVVVAGAELFTGNNLIIMAWASSRVSTAALLRNWLVVYGGNFVGAIATAGLVAVAKVHTFGDGAVGSAALSIAAGKTDLGFVQAIALGALCNALVCLAVWLTYTAHTTTDKIVAIVPPITAFVALGFEHSIANMYAIPLGLLIREDHGFVASLPQAPDLQGLTWSSFLLDNLLPVTIGNVVGGALMVGAVYWFVYLRPGRAARERAEADKGGG